MNPKFIYNGIKYNPEEFLSISSSSEIWLDDLRSFLSAWLRKEKSFNISTSGSTGKPKSIEIDRKDMELSAQLTLDYLQIKEGESAMLCLPTKYIGGKMMMVRSFAGNLELYIVEATKDPLIGIEHDIDFIAITPYQLASILERQESMEKLKKIRNVIVGGGQVNQSVAKEIRNWSNNVYNTFGMSESISHFALSKINSSDPDVFRIISDKFQIEIDNESRLIVHSPYKEGEKLQTNDIIELINERSFRWKGRYDNVINSGGIKFSPEELESMLLSEILDPFIISAIDDKKFGQQIALIIESENQDQYLIKNFKERISSILPDYSSPKKIFIVPRLIRTENGKIDRKNSTKFIA